MLVLILILLMASNVYADRVLIRKSDGVPIEYQSGDAVLGTLKKNNPQYDESEVEEKYITKEEFEILFEEKILKPEREKQTKEKKKIEDKVKASLNLTDTEFKDLKEALQ